MAYIGIVVPVYKVKKEYLDECVKSLINQTFRDIEIVLVDDCSPDDCGKWCDEYAAQDRRIKTVHHKKNLGLPSARNTGLDNLNAEWVTFVDSDDWLDTDSCEKLVAYLNKWTEKPDMIIFTGCRNYPSVEVISPAVFDNETWFCGHNEIEQLQEKSFSFTHKSYPANAVNLDSACWRLISTDYLNKNNIRFIDIPYREDGLFFLYSTESAERIVYIYEPFYHYRDTGNSMVNMYRCNADLEHKQYFDEIWKFTRKYNKSREFTDNLYYAVFLSMQICITQKYFCSKNTDSFFKRHKQCKEYFSREPYSSVFKKIKISKLRRNHKVKAILIYLKLYSLVSGLRNLYNKEKKKENFN